MQALAKDPAKRFPTAHDLLVALDRALPANMRLSSDQEVAKYVNGLFAEKRDRQKAELQAALIRADERARTDVVPTLREYLDSQPPPSRASISGVSGVTGEISDVSSVSTVGVGLPQSAGTPADQQPSPAVAQRRSRAPLVIGAVVGLLALAGAVGFFVLRARSPARPATPPVALTEPTSPAAVSPLAPSAEIAPSAEQGPAVSTEGSAAPEPSAAPGGKPKRVGGKWPIAPPASAKDKPPAGKPPATPGLKVDKVFE
jgi:hypothetical protein